MTGVVLLPARAPVHTLAGRASVCVVVPLYNYAHYVEQCLASVLSQEGIDITAIVIDDKSTDDGLAVASRLAANDPRVTVVANSVNRGHIPTVNAGMRLVDAEFVVKLDADDLLTPGSLARSVALMQAHPDVGFVYGFPLIFAETPPALPDAVARSWRIWPGRKWIEMMCRRGVNRIAQPEALIRTSALRAAGDYREQLPHTSDFEMWLRLAAVADVGRVNGPYQGCYRRHAESMSQTVHRGALRDVAERRRAFDSFFAGTYLADVERLQHMSRRTLAHEALGHAISCLAREDTSGDSVADWEQFVLETWPDAVRTRPWRALRRTSVMSTRRVRIDPAVRTRESLRNLRFAVEWRAWRRFGV